MYLAYANEQQKFNNIVSCRLVLSNHHICNFILHTAYLESSPLFWNSVAGTDSYSAYFTQGPFGRGSTITFANLILLRIIRRLSEILLQS
jgi:hypothetical protein